jgi:hypothetical protein
MFEAIVTFIKAERDPGDDNMPTGGIVTEVHRLKFETESDYRIWMSWGKTGWNSEHRIEELTPPTRFQS